MGVYGLTTWLNNQKGFNYYFDLNRFQTTEYHLAADFLNICHNFSSCFAPHFIEGIDGVSLYRYAVELFSELRARNIIVHLFVEIPNQEDLLFKFDRSKEIWETEYIAMMEIPEEMYESSHRSLPLHGSFGFMQAAHQTGHRLVFVPGEGDSYMAHAVASGVCSAVWSSDSDFLVFPKCRMLELRNFKMVLENLQQNKKCKHKLISSEDIARRLKLTEADLITFSSDCRL
ncbi:hypothetical protein GEMRC1_003587 [Eukaryota sp. GEM-RC1]